MMSLRGEWSVRGTEPFEVVLDARLDSVASLARRKLEIEIEQVLRQQLKTDEQVVEALAAGLRVVWPLPEFLESKVLFKVWIEWPDEGVITLEDEIQSGGTDE